MLDRVDPEPVDVEVCDHPLEDVDEAVLDHGMLGEEVVESEEVPVQRVLAGECRVAAVVVVDRVVQPRRSLHCVGARIDERRCVGETRCNVEVWERPCARVIAVVELGAICICVRVVVLVAIREHTLFIGHHVTGVVRNDVEEHLDSKGMRRSDQGVHLGVRAEVGIDLVVVDLPVSVVAG